MNERIVRGIVISVMPLGEYDRRIELLTAEIGRISVFARGARKPGSPLISITRVMALGEFQLYQGKTSYTLKGARIRDYFEELTTDVELSYYGFYFLEVAQYFSRENVEASRMLELLFYSLKALNRTSIPKALIKSIFELKMLDLNGLCPPLDRLLSGRGSYAFAEHMSPGCQKAFQHVLAQSVQKQYTFTLTPEVLEEFSGMVHHLMQQSTDRPFKALALINGEL